MKISIHDSNLRGGLDVDLRRILACFEKQGNGLYWSILWLSGASGDMSCLGTTMTQILDQSHELPPSIVLSWDELTLLADQVVQIVDGIFLGVSDRKLLASITSVEFDDLMVEISDFFIEAVDSTYWKVATDDIDLIECIRSNFRDVRSMDTTD